MSKGVVVKVVFFRRPLVTCAFLALTSASVLSAARGARAEDAPATPASAKPDSVPAAPPVAPVAAPAPALAPAAPPAVRARRPTATPGKTKTANNRRVARV